MKQLIIIPMLAAFGSYRSAGAQTNAGLEKTFELVRTSLTVHEPVVVKFTATNHLPVAVTTYKSLDTRLTRPDGRAPDGPPSQSPDYFGPNPILPLAPFETRSTLLLLNKTYYFDVPGRYALNVTNYDETPGPPPKQVISLPYQSLTIDISPRDPARLSQVCGQLETAIDAGPTTAEGYEAAEALAYMDDPVAVPYIARVLATDSRMFRWRLFPALARIGDAAAAETLISYLWSADEEERTLARRDLSFILQATSDPSTMSWIIFARIVDWARSSFH